MSQPITRAQRRAALATTQQQHPWRATIRTGLAFVVGIATAVPPVIAIVDDELNGWALLGFGGQAIVVSSIITRIMATPAVDAVLERIGLGSAPAPRF